MKSTNAKTGSFAVTALLLSAASASAISYTLQNFDSPGYTGPFGTVNVVLTSANQAMITFTSENGYLFTGISSDAVNVNSRDFTAALISDNASAGLGAFSLFNSGVEVGEWGTFNLTLNQNTGANDLASVISFSVTDLAGATWASADDVLDANSDGHDVAADMTVPGGGSTGFATDGSINVPDSGSTAVLLGTGLSAIGLIRRKLGRFV